jgi:hypothetical protein
MVAVLIVAVLIVVLPILEVLFERVPIVIVPVDAVMVDPKVTGPKRLLLLETVKDPVLLTSDVERERADVPELSPLVIA